MTDHRRIEDRLRLLAELEAALMIAAPSCDATLAEVARIVVRDFADWFVVDIIDDDGTKHLKVECSDPAKRALVEALEAIPEGKAAPDLLAGALRDRRATLVTDVDTNDAEPEAERPTHLAWLRTLGVRSLITAPIISHDRLLGAFAFLSAREDRRYGPMDLRFAEDLGRVAALALDNVERYRTTQRAIAARDDVMGIVAHDLRNPLNAVLLQSEILRRSGAPAERSSDSPTTAIRRSVQQMNRLIQDMLDVARLEGGTLAVDRRPLPARSLLDDVQIMQREAAEAAELRVRIDAPEDLPDVFADRGRMFQVFGNLIGNSIKFMSPGGEIALGAKAAAGEVLFWATDTGPGIPPEQLPHLFDRFWQAKKTDRRGAGLGLSIVKGIITAHGGRIWVESRMAEGTTFYFTVPLAAPPEAEAPAPSR